MKNLFGINNKETNFQKFVVRSVSDTSNAKIDELSKKAKIIENKELGPSWLKLVSTMCIGFGIIGIFGIIFAKDGFKEALKTRGYIFVIAIILFIVGVALTIYYGLKSKKIQSNKNFKTFLNEQELLKKEIQDELKIPKDSTEIDVLFTKVKENKEGKEITKSMGLFSHLNGQVFLYIEDDKVYFADLAAVIELPLDSFKSVTKINKTVVIPQWNKDVPYNNEKYKKFNIRQNGYGMLYVKPYYSIKLVVNDEEYEILIPNYDIDKFLNVVPLSIND